MREEVFPTSVKYLICKSEFFTDFLAMPFANKKKYFTKI